MVLVSKLLPWCNHLHRLVTFLLHIPIKFRVLLIYLKPDLGPPSATPEITQDALSNQCHPAIYHHHNIHKSNHYLSPFFSFLVLVSVPLDCSLFLVGTTTSCLSFFTSGWMILKHSTHCRPGSDFHHRSPMIRILPSFLLLCHFLPLTYPPFAQMNRQS